MNDQLGGIIKRRMRRPLAGVAIVVAVCAYTLVVERIAPPAVALVAGPALAMMASMVLISACKSAGRAPLGDWAERSAGNAAEAGLDLAAAGLFVKMAHEGRRVDRLLAQRGY